MTHDISESWQGYRPLEYDAPPAWGDGARIACQLSPLERQVWDIALPLQDLRGDYGHAELVVWTTIQFCRLLECSDEARQIAVLAAICHDTGYARIPDIHDRFHAAFNDLRAGRGEDAFWSLKREHEAGAVANVKAWLGGYSGMELVLQTVACHDTRTEACPPAGRPMWDADRLWRFTVLAHRTYRAGIGYDDLRKQMLRELATGDWQTPIGARAAEIELQNSLQIMFPERP